MAVWTDSRNGTMVVDADDEDEAREILTFQEYDLDLATFERTWRRHGAPLDCGCIPHVTRIRGMWGFYCETEDQGYCNFECPHQDEDDDTVIDEEV